MTREADYYAVDETARVLGMVAGARAPDAPLRRARGRAARGADRGRPRALEDTRACRTSLSGTPESRGRRGHRGAVTQRGNHRRHAFWYTRTNVRGGHDRHTFGGLRKAF